MHRLCLPSPLLCQPFLSLPLQPVFAPMLQSNPRMLTSGSHPQAIVSSSTPQYPSAEQPTPQALYGEFCCTILLQAVLLSSSSVLSTYSFPLSCCSHCSPVLSTPCHATPCPPAAAGHHAYWEPATVPACSPQSCPGACHGGSEWGRNGWLEVRDRARGNSPVVWLRGQQVKGLGTRGVGGTHPSPPPDSTRRGRPHTWAVDSHSRICTTQGP